MHKLPAVEEARAMMREGMGWSAWRWLIEKPRVRKIADRATAALDRADKKIKATWSEQLKGAYAELASRKAGKHRSQDPATDAPPITAEILTLALRVMEADEKAERCRLAAERTFDEAEQRFSAEMARQGARKALHTYDLREAAIRESEAAAQLVQVPAHGDSATVDSSSH